MNYEPRVHYFALALLITFLSVTQLAAQDRKNIASAFRSLPTEFLIEVRKDDGCLFAPITRIERTTSLQQSEFNPAVSESNKSYIAIRGSLVHTFPRPYRYQPDSFGRPIVSHVMFSAFQIGDSWKVKVAIGTGEFFDAGDQPFADFTLRTNERVEVGGLDRFGFGSFRVGVVRVNRETSEKPFISSRAASVEVDKIEPGGGPGTYRLTLRNNSKKDILAVQYNASKNYKFLFLKWFENAQSTPLVKSGEVYKFDVATEDQQCGGTQMAIACRRSVRFR